MRRTGLVSVALVAVSFALCSGALYADDRPGGQQSAGRGGSPSGAGHGGVAAGVPPAGHRGAVALHGNTNGRWPGGAPRAWHGGSDRGSRGGSDHGWRGGSDRGWRGDIRHFPDRDFGQWRGGQWHHGWHDGRRGAWWVVGGLWYFYPSPIYPYPNPYVPPVQYLPAPAPALVEYWYYCANPPGYYPYVPQCATAWQPVPATVLP